MSELNEQETADAPGDYRGGTLDAAQQRAGSARWESGARLAGRYELQEELGRGGMGAVYRARDMELDRDVAIKVLLVAGRELSTERFEREARALSRLRSPNVVAVHDVGEHAGRPFLVMDFVPGESLAQRLKRGPLPVAEAVELARVLAWAISHAHEQGILHRDLKPENVLLQTGGAPRVVDFGLARFHDERVRLTLSGAAMGTPAFWPPEQALGKREQIGPRSDVYGLGAILYAALTARAPFEGLSLMELINATIDTMPDPPSAWNRHVPAGLDELCLKCLAKEPEERFESAEALALALDGLQRAPGRSTGRGLKKRVAAWACVALSVAGGVAALSQSRSSRQDLAAAERAAAVLGPEQRLQRALVRFHQDRGQEALEELDALSEMGPYQAHAFEVRGDVHAMLLGQNDLAEKAYTQSLALVPDNATALSSRGVTRHRLGRSKEALADLDRAVSLRGSHVNHLNRGAARLEGGDVRGALADFDRCVALEPNDPDGHAARSWAYRTLGDTARAMKEAETAVRLDPKHVDGLFNRSTLFYKQGKFERAKADLELILRLDADNAEALYAMAAVHEQLGNLRSALDYSERALARDPDNPMKRASRGILREKTGDLLRGREDLEAALPHLDPGQQDLVKKALARIRARRGR